MHRGFFVLADFARINMVTKKYFEQIKNGLPDHEDPYEALLVDKQRCPACGLAQWHAPKTNFKNGKGFAVCANPDCDNVEEIGIDREHEYCARCDRLSHIERTITIKDKLRITLVCGHAIGWASS